MMTLRTRRDTAEWLRAVWTALITNRHGTTCPGRTETAALAAVEWCGRQPDACARDESERVAGVRMDGWALRRSQERERGERERCTVSESCNK